ncbi:hypothetical protein QFZ99_000858 [Paraburkholderia atlantica]|uniref:DUF4148 domain-containing protein n=1 Tax=Paraburkholderia atlantica TaxID=2654982 RepID=UPI003D1FB88E
MKQIFVAGTLALLASSPVASFAQTDAPVTRAQVRAELVKLERAGYNPIPDDVDYPSRLQKAEARLQAEEPASLRHAATKIGTEQR